MVMEKDNEVEISLARGIKKKKMELKEEKRTEIKISQ